jgi:hypothetical protein
MPLPPRGFSIVAVLDLLWVVGVLLPYQTNEGENKMEEMAQCTRCEDMVAEDSLAIYLDWKLCEVCQDDI